MKKKTNLFKKIFIFLSIVLLLTLISVYSYRLIHFYLLENGSNDVGIKRQYFSDKLKRTINVSNLNGGLYIIENEYLYKFNANKNYLWYSGQLWRMLKINEDKTIDIIMEEPLTILNIDKNNNYINNYLKDFYDKLDKEFLVEISYCNDKFDNLDRIKCEEKEFADITLLDFDTYQKAGGNSSFLNNNSTFWVINKNKEGDNWYINSNGSLAIGNSVNSFGIRPVVRLKSEINAINGDGTENDPYIIKEKKSNYFNIGEYVKFNDSLWRIIDLNDEAIIVASEDCLSENGTCILKSFGDTNIFKSSSLHNYLNETYYNSIDNKDFIVQNDFYIGNYMEHNYHNTTLNSIQTKIGISKVSDYYIYNKTNSYLLTTNDLKAVYTINKNSNYYLDFPSEEKEIYPVLSLDINLKITFGDGTKNNPYILNRW